MLIILRNEVECFMKDLTKKFMILAMVGMVQVGFSAAISGLVQVGVNTAIAEASPLQKFDQHKIVHFDDRRDDQQKPIVPQL